MIFIDNLTDYKFYIVIVYIYFITMWQLFENIIY